jgi:hypothetical protein
LIVRFAGPARLAAFGVALAGCYTLQPAARPTAPADVRYAFDINDEGRVALGGAMGPEIAQVEGRVIGVDSAEMNVAVSAVRLLNGTEQVWRGESVRIKKEYVKSAYERRFSSGRTLAFAASVVGSVAAVFVGQSLIGSGTEGPINPPDTGVALRRP